MAINVREYTKDDAELVSGWWSHRRTEPFPLALLPPVGVIVEQDKQPVAACWLYMAVGVGVCWPEFPATKPGLTLKESRKFLGLALEALEVVALTHDYGLMSVHATAPLARSLKSFGFTESSRGIVNMVKLLR